MKNTYEAIIDGDKVTWVGERPNDVGSLSVTIKIRKPIVGTDGKILAEMARRMIAETGGITSVKDPVAWQRAQRSDRPLPGREP